MMKLPMIAFDDEGLGYDGFYKGRGGKLGRKVRV